jgi:diaminohydroxyphosphoribosylaminopyrimidine deaminase/5-amino-6-(5-phosphoribosylamino)uracil reductase
MEANKIAERLASENLGNTSPNPSVGAVITKNGAVVSQGVTQPVGGSHAEVVAIDNATADLSECELYVTLEPCCHYGRTGPCTKRIIESGIRTVYIGCEDPNPLVSGKGIQELKNNGITILPWPSPNNCDLLYEGFAKFINTGEPFFTAKFAMTLDGKICTETGDSKWISNGISRRIVHQIRRKSDAIIVGINTVNSDDPLLTARDDNGVAWSDRQPARIVLDSKLRTLPTANLFKQPGRTIIATTVQDNTHCFPGDTKILICSPGSDGRIDPHSLINQLAKIGFVNILIEGGSQVLGTMFDNNLVDKVYAFIAPMIIGGTSARSPIGGLGTQFMVDSIKLENILITTNEDDVLVAGYIKNRKKKV